MTTGAVPLGPSMTPALHRIHPRDAARLILETVAPLPAERVPLAEALSRVLAAAVTSPIDVPQGDNSAMDGYAVRAEDLRDEAGDVVLRVVEEIPAGARPSRALGPGECARIFTGAAVPQGADGVIRQEHTTRLDVERVRIDDVSDAGANIRYSGEDIARGSVVLERGVELRAAQLGVLASIAAREIDVHRAPRVAVLASGDELAGLDEVDAILAGRRLASSNTYTMLGMVREAGAVPLDLGIARDDPAELRDRLGQAAEADFIVTSGGMSVGERDYLREMMERDSDMRFWRLRSRPGAPVGFSTYDGTPWLGLPGNPVSTMVTFELLARPAIRRLQGHSRVFRRAVPVRLGEPVTTPAALTHFLRVTLEDHGSATPTARLTGPQGSGILTSMARADALLVVPEEVESADAGKVLHAIVLNDGVHVSEVPY